MKSGDEILVQRAARQLAVRTAALVALAMLLLVGIVTVVVVRGQSATATTLLRTTAATADDVGDPPPGAWIVITEGPTTRASPGLPTALLTRLAELRSAEAPGTVISELKEDDGTPYRIATRHREVLTVQVVLDLTTEHAQRDRLLRAMGVAAILALLFAVGLGVVLGRRAVLPLADALALQRTFIADASHELRTPLTLLSTRAQVLDRALAAAGVADQVREDSAGVVNDVHRISEVLEDLLVAADPRSEQPIQSVDVLELARSAVASARAHADEAGVSVGLIDAERRGLTVTGSEPALRRALLALIDNAIEHTPASGSVTVTVGGDRRDVVVCVADSGPGVSASAAPYVLRRFHSGGQRSGRAHYGLGLALTHDVANRYGGGLRLLPSDGGAVFELRLPRNS